MNPQVAVIDFGSQYTQLIVRRIRELGYMAKLYLPSQLAEIGSPKGVILSGGPRSTREENAPDIDFDFLQKLDVPVLGICYGMQLLNLKFGGDVTPGTTREYGPAILHPESGCALFNDITPSQIWMSHSDTCTGLSDGTSVIARNQEDIAVALQFSDRFFGIQFHPEVTHSEQGTTVIKNYLDMLDDVPRFDIEQFREELVGSIKDQVGGRRVVCGVSGGVDSTVLAVLLHKAGVDLHCIFVDHGLLRKNEAVDVMENFKELGIEVDLLQVSDQFFGALAGESNPETKRKIIGNLFLDVFFEHASDLELFAQGTLYPDVIESATSGSDASRIKTHHNRVDRVLELQKEGKVIEPLAELFKDEVRELGKSLGIREEILWRHPFPGPGLAVRIPGEVTPEKVVTLQAADHIYIETLRKHGWYDKIWQACTTLIPSKTVGVKGDERAYENPIALRAVISEDAMTADWVEIPHVVLREISNRILNEVPGINRVLYDISTKPPASIEWE